VSSRRPLRAVLCIVGLILLVVGFARGADFLLRERAAGVEAQVAASPFAPTLAPGAVRLAVPGTVPSACMAYSPIGAANGHTVFLDPGHGGLDPGATGVSTAGVAVTEKNATLAVALALSTELRTDGYRVVLSRTKDTLVTQVGEADARGGALTSSAELRDLRSRIGCANASQAVVLVAIHFNGFADPEVGGTETLYDPARAFATANRKLARALQSALVAALRLPDRGVLRDDQLDAPTLTDTGATYGHLVELGPALAGYVDTPTGMPGALVEPLFVTDATEANFVTSGSGQQRIATALKSGIEMYLA
jgi:N-acetylmuramoyl-L-alanine amidase